MKSRSFLKIAVIAIVFVSAIVSLVAFFNSRKVTPILMYHSIDVDPDKGTLSVSPENFKRQMSFLSREGYRVVSLDELVSSIKEGRKYLPRTVAITFDDGFEDNYVNAFPVLAKYHMPAAIFLITGYVGKKDKYLNWDQVRLMSKNGISFGCHTRNNVYMPSLKSESALWDEIIGSKTDLEINTGAQARYFCYPTGGFNLAVIDVIKKAGFTAAFSTNRGERRDNTDIYALKRVKITNSDMVKPLHFRAKLSGLYNFFRSFRDGD